MELVFKVCIPHTFRDSFDYQSQDIHPQIGARVWVPFRNQRRLGVIVAKGTIEKEGLVLKNITEILDEQPILSQSLLELCFWVATYYQSPLSEVLPLALPKKYRLGEALELPKSDYYQLIASWDEISQKITKRASRQLELVSFLSEQKQGVSKKILTDKGFNSSQLLALLQAKVIRLTQETIKPAIGSKTLAQPLMLNAEQKHALDQISKTLEQYQCFLLQGITGSGKTEVYLQVITEVLALGKQVLIIVPEIGLTPQLLARFTERFNEPMAVIHSNLNETERALAWQYAKEELVKIVIGTRSAVFTPMPSLGLIIIDEEHDASLKQMEGVRYSARDTALMRAYSSNIPVILGSATPSLESLYNCQNNKYSVLRLTQKALSKTPLSYQLVDLRAQSLTHGLATQTLIEIEQHLKKNNQVLIFINRRGFAPVLLCHQCGWIADCKACDSHLTLHKQDKQLLCHHCGLMVGPPQSCPVCKNKEFIPVGVGTQRIHEFLSRQFPKTNVLRIDRDEINKKNALEEHLDKINKGQAQLIIGTQMLAKGHHFPMLSLVVVLDADAGFYNLDFKAAEQLGQLLTQVAGRAGRAEQVGRVLIQTHLPQHPLLNKLIQEGYDAFAKSLLLSRQQAELPPFQFLAVIRAQGKVAAKVIQFLNSCKERLQIHSITAMGPAPAPLARKANQYRMQLLVKSSSRPLLKQVLQSLRQWVEEKKLGNNLRWNIDVDPMDLS